MLKHITVPIIVDDYNAEICSMECQFYYDNGCLIFPMKVLTMKRCRECLDGAK